MNNDQPTPAVLQGIRILDMALYGPGPFCARILGDLGADIVKVHEPGMENKGGPISLQFPDSPRFPGLRNCRFVALNLKSEAGRSVFYDLVRKADVVTESLRPGTAGRLGVDYEALTAINPLIIYLSLSGYGQQGPYRDVAGHDINYISIGGILGMTGKAGDRPVIPGTLIADFAAGGMSAAIAILAALLHREKIGKGQYIDLAMTDAVVGLMGEWINPYLNFGELLKRGESMFTGLWPWYNVYETKDGSYVSVGAVEPWFYKNLCELLGCEEYIEHQYSEGEKREEIFRFFRTTFLTKNRDEWVELLRTEDTCVAPVYSIDEVAGDPHLIARGMIADMPHPEMGSVKQVGPFIKLPGSPFTVRNWATHLGQHTQEILLELGYDKARIDSLRQSGAIG